MYTRYLERGDKLYENSPKIAQHLLIIALTTIRASRAAGMNFPTGPRADGRVRVTRASTIVQFIHYITWLWKVRERKLTKFKGKENE